MLVMKTIKSNRDWLLSRTSLLLTAGSHAIYDNLLNSDLVQLNYILPFNIFHNEFHTKTKYTQMVSNAPIKKIPLNYWMKNYPPPVIQFKSALPAGAKLKFLRIKNHKHSLCVLKFNCGLWNGNEFPNKY